jgi:hypothetical protein
MGAQAEANPATLIQYNAWGERVDIINTYFLSLTLFVSIQTKYQSRSHHSRLPF